MKAGGGPGFIQRHKALGRDFGRFWSARTLSILGDQIAAIAMTAYSYELSRSAAVTSMMVAALTVPRLISPFADPGSSPRTQTGSPRTGRSVVSMPTRFCIAAAESRFATAACGREPALSTAGSTSVGVGLGQGRC